MMELDRREIEIPPELDGFSLLFPLPFRLALIVVAGPWTPLRNQEGKRAMNRTDPICRLLGLGGESALLVQIEDRKAAFSGPLNKCRVLTDIDLGCPGFDSISCATVAQTNAALCLCVSSCDAVDDSTRNLPSPFLDDHIWLHRTG